MVSILSVNDPFVPTAIDGNRATVRGCCNIDIPLYAWAYGDTSGLFFVHVYTSAALKIIVQGKPTFELRWASSTNIASFPNDVIIDMTCSKYGMHSKDRHDWNRVYPVRYILFCCII